MRRSKFYQSFFVLVVAATVIWPAVANGSTTENLLVNGDAELQRCTNDWTAQTSIPGWRVLRGAASVLCYSAFEFTQETPVTPSNMSPGNALFAALAPILRWTRASM